MGVLLFLPTFPTTAASLQHKEPQPIAMASRILARSKALNLAAALTRAAADVASPIAGARALSSLPRYPSAPSPHGLGKVRSCTRSLVACATYFILAYRNG